MSQLPIDTRQFRSGSSARKQAKSEQESIWTRDIELTKAFGLKEKKTFYELLAVLLTAGLSIIDSLEVIGDQHKKKKVQAIIEQIVQHLQEGLPLSTCLEKQAKHFNRFEIHSVRMGERGGKLADVLKELGRYYEGRLTLQRKLIQVMTYPVMVILMAVGVVYFMVVKVVPMFEDVFKQFDAELPYITRKILDLSMFLQAYGGWMVLGILLVSGFFYWVKDSLRFQRIMSSIVIRIPVFGSLLLKVHLARFSLTMGTLLQAKVHLDEAIELAQEIVTFYPIASELPRIKQKITEGKPFYSAIKDLPIFPTLLKQMVKVGERTATLDQMFRNLGKSLEQESETEISNLTNILEPLLVIVLGLIVGVILISMYLPMFQLSQAVSI